MKLDLVDEHDCFASKRIVFMRVPLRHPPSKICRQCQYNPIAAAELVERKVFRRFRICVQRHDKAKRTEFDSWIAGPRDH